MPDRIVPLDVNSIYHIYNRGVNKESIFFSERNYQYFLYKMGTYFREKAIVLAYCLMPNHFHLLVQIKSIEFIQIIPPTVSYLLYAISKYRSR